MILVIAPDLFSRPALEADAGTRSDHRVMALSTAQLAAGNIYALAILPACHKLVNVITETDQLDTGNQGAISVGVLNNYPLLMSTNAANTAYLSASTYNSGNPLVQYTGTTPDLVSGQNIFTADTNCQTSGGKRIYPSSEFTNAIGVDYKNDRVIAFKFSTLPQTPAAANFGLIIQIDAA